MLVCLWCLLGYQRSSPVTGSSLPCACCPQGSNLFCLHDCIVSGTALNDCLCLSSSSCLPCHHPGLHGLPAAAPMMLQSQQGGSHQPVSQLCCRVAGLESRGPCGLSGWSLLCKVSSVVPARRVQRHVAHNSHHAQCLPSVNAATAATAATIIGHCSLHKSVTASSFDCMSAVPFPCAVLLATVGSTWIYSPPTLRRTTSQAWLQSPTRRKRTSCTLQGTAATLYSCCHAKSISRRGSGTSGTCYKPGTGPPTLPCHS